MRTLPFLHIVVLCASSVALLAHSGAQQQNARPRASVWNGVYTAAQAERGKQLYGRHCARCHGDDLANSRNPLAGDRFADHWESRTLADLFRATESEMAERDTSTDA